VLARRLVLVSALGAISIAVVVGAVAQRPPPQAAVTGLHTPAVALVEHRMQAPRGAPTLDNRAAYIPAQCYAETRDEPSGRTYNGCFACHQESLAPNYVDDADVQLELSLPRFATVNRWTHWLAPLAPLSLSDAELLDRVRRSNYLSEQGELVLAQPPAAWDEDGNGRWDGLSPDCWFQADADGWDRDARGQFTGWRAYAYTPLPGLFWPTNGSAGDAFVRLPEAYRQDADGAENLALYALNLALLEAFIRRTDVPIAATDERAVGEDLDGDGTLGTARKVAFVWPPRGQLHYLGQAASLDPAVHGWPAAGLYPAGTELIHSLRYLDVVRGRVKMAARLKELRYMRKQRWYTYGDLDQRAKLEMREKEATPDQLKLVLADAERGVATGTGWRMQAFIEDERGALRPETVEETTACIGCHGGVGVTTDSTFSFARKLGGTTPDAGWYHWLEKGLAGIPEPRRADGRGEYAVWLEQVGGGDDFRTNSEVQHKFFDANAKLLPRMARALAADISVLVVPSPARALALDRAYLALVAAQSFAEGRDVVLGKPRIHRRVVQDAPTGVEKPLAPASWTRATTRR
jgi:hypothetical protein